MVLFFFFFQAEDGIRDVAVTGVQTCALPICQWVVFLSFMQDVAPDDHPFYKHVYLRLMPAGSGGGSSARVIGYVYGGQGTINVPSWSPDSRRVAFVSNSDLRRLP